MKAYLHQATVSTTCFPKVGHVLTSLWTITGWLIVVSTSPHLLNVPSRSDIIILLLNPFEPLIYISKYNLFIHLLLLNTDNLLSPSFTMGNLDSPIALHVSKTHLKGFVRSIMTTFSRLFKTKMFLTLLLGFSFFPFFLTILFLSQMY